MRFLIALLLPWLVFFTMGKVVQGIICLILQLTLIGRVLWLYRWPIFLADEDRQGDWPWDFGASGVGVKSTSRTG